MTVKPPYDLAIIGGGINGAGIACDAAGRGLSVALIEAEDLAGATSSASSKLIHGGLRYLENGEFRLVREALSEREILLNKAPHIIRPMRFILPHAPSLRPRWMIRLGLFLYDHLSTRKTLPASGSIDFSRDPCGRPLKPGFQHGFAYWDCSVDDARLVVLNARAAADRRAEILVRTSLRAATAEQGVWRLSLTSADKRAAREILARAVVNATGPWVDRVLNDCLNQTATDSQPPRLRLVKGSHIVVPRIENADDAYILQQEDGRVIFVLPYEKEFSLIGTTDVPISGDPRNVTTDREEIDYLLSAANSYLADKLRKSDVVWIFAGVRPLFDDQADSPSRVTRDYRLMLTTSDDRPPLLSVLGGKITTYRRLAEEVLDKLAPHFPTAAGPWTKSARLPGGDLPPGGMNELIALLTSRYPDLETDLISGLARRHGSRTEDVLGDAHTTGDMGRHIGADLYEREVDYLRRNEWAQTPEDILWRRTKVGLHLNTTERETASNTLRKLL